MSKNHDFFYACCYFYIKDKNKNSDFDVSVRKIQHSYNSVFINLYKNIIEKKPPKYFYKKNWTKSLFYNFEVLELGYVKEQKFGSFLKFINKDEPHFEIKRELLKIKLLE